MGQKQDIRIFHLLHRVHQAMFRASDKVLGEALGISTTQSALLLFLKHRDGVSMGELAAGIGVKLTSLSGLIDRVEQKGYVARRRSTQDRRSFEVSLTPAGREMLTMAEPLVTSANDAILQKIGSKAEARAFAAACESIIEFAEEMYADTASPAKLDTNNSKTVTS